LFQLQHRLLEVALCVTAEFANADVTDTIGLELGFNRLHLDDGACDADFEWCIVAARDGELDAGAGRAAQ
jgi:hypothetical protein